MRHSPGFTLLELIVVLILMGIVAAYVLGRSLATEAIDLTAQADRIRNHLRYAQIEAMKRSDTVWGIKSTGGTDGHYWLFHGTDPDAGKIRIPGASYADGDDRISLAALNIELEPAFVVFFNRVGRPYSAFTDLEDDSRNTRLAAELAITVKAGGETRAIGVTPETGLVR